MNENYVSASRPQERSRWNCEKCADLLDQSLDFTRLGSWAYARRSSGAGEILAYYVRIRPAVLLGSHSSPNRTVKEEISLCSVSVVARLMRRSIDRHSVTDGGELLI